MNRMPSGFGSGEVFFAPGVAVVRQDVAMPSVVENDPDAIEKLTEMAVDVIDFAIPGCAIDASEEPIDSRERTVMHQEMTQQALSLVSPSLDFDSFEPQGLITKDQGSYMHADNSGYSQGTTREGNMEMELRIQTAIFGGAEVLMANARVQPELIGDEELYYYTGDSVGPEGLSYGYDPSLRRVRHRGIYAHVEDGVSIPFNDVEPTVYHHTQAQGSSMLFRSKATSGTVAAHSFMPAHPDMQMRLIEISTMSLHSRRPV